VRVLRFGHLGGVVVGLCVVACSASGGAPSGHGGTGASAGSGGQPSGQDAAGGDGSVIQVDSGGGQDGSFEAAFNDATPDVQTTCVEGGTQTYTPGPYPHKCAPPTDNECDGHSDSNPALPNGQYGNGFDDDCDGLVDEGCPCPPGVVPGQTERCYLVPASQADLSTRQPVGWCATNSVGSEACTTQGTGEFTKNVWSGECRGAQPPFASDVCAPGDFDCDGRDGNSKTQDCHCKTPVIQCPTNPLVTAPYPDPKNLPEIDGSTWITGGANPADAKNWKWTITGGDCDNILPHPSFQVYNNQIATGQALGGTQASGLGPNSDQTGLIDGPGTGVDNTLYLAFALSGDYLVKGEFDLDGQHYSCTQQVQVRAPGIRAELCWTPMPNDMDLHFARLQGANCSTHGWFETCSTGAGYGDDCYYAAGCSAYENDPGWGYPDSASSVCSGWGSRRAAASFPDPPDCTNPRLDMDNISCDPSVLNPNSFGILSLSGPFCGAENINLDNPNDGDRFLVGAHAYNTSDPIHPHINVYCNGERVLSVGYDPNTNPAFPVMLQSGPENGQEVPDDGGDFWEAATIVAHVANGQLTSCDVAPVHSATPKANKDGSVNYCIDTNPENTNPPPADDEHWNFIASGQYPSASDPLCWH
jgi:hypothetical protein